MRTSVATSGTGHRRPSTEPGPSPRANRPFSAPRPSRTFDRRRAHRCPVRLGAPDSAVATSRITTSTFWNCTANVCQGDEREGRQFVRAVDGEPSCGLRRSQSVGRRRQVWTDAPAVASLADMFASISTSSRLSNDKTTAILHNTARPRDFEWPPHGSQRTLLRYGFRPLRADYSAAGSKSPHISARRAQPATTDRFTSNTAVGCRQQSAEHLSIGASLAN